MQVSPTIIFGLALFVFVLAFLPDKYRPTWIHRLNSWQALIGLVAVIAAILIVMNPEFYALGILGDSAFFDLLVLAITCQLQVSGSRIWGHIATGFSITKRFVSWRLSVTCSMLLFACDDIVSPLQKIVHRISS